MHATRFPNNDVANVFVKASWLRLFQRLRLTYAVTQAKHRITIPVPVFLTIRLAVSRKNFFLSFEAWLSPAPKKKKKIPGKTILVYGTHRWNVQTVPYKPEEREDQY